MKPDFIYETLKYLLQTARQNESNPVAHAKASELLEQLEAIKAEEIAAHAEIIVRDTTLDWPLEPEPAEAPKTEAPKA